MLVGVRFVWLSAPELAFAFSHLPRQSKELRSLDSTIPFELDMMRGGCLKVERLSLQGLLYSKGYKECGIEMGWPAMSLASNSARMAVADDFSETLAELTFAVIEQHVRRNLTFSHGMPRRQVCLLDAWLAPRFLDELKLDMEIHDQIKTLGFDGHDQYMQRSTFNYVAVKQLIGCLREEEWKVTPRPNGVRACELARLQFQTGLHFFTCFPRVAFQFSGLHCFPCSLSRFLRVSLLVGFAFGVSSHIPALRRHVTDTAL